MVTTKALGDEGEERALAHLRRAGLELVQRNYRVAGGPGRPAAEVDLILRERDGTLVFVEVKTRSSEDFGRPFSAVDRKKRRRIIRGAMAWLRMLELPDLTFRFDVVEVVASEPPEVRILENAFQLPANYYY